MSDLVSSNSNGPSRFLKESTNLGVAVELSPNPDIFVMLLLPFELLEVIRIVACFRNVRTI